MSDPITKENLGFIQKQVSENTYRFIMSDESIDRDGDIIMSDGWDLKEFKKNPVALAHHDATKIIGRWKNVKVHNKQLTGDLELAPDDVGAFQRAINKLISGGFLKAVSVGFRATEHEPREEGGYRFLKQSLFETSVVAVPSNSSALAIAKSCNLNDSEFKNLFITQSSSDNSIGDSATNPKVKRAKQAIINANRLMRKR